MQRNPELQARPKQSMCYHADVFQKEFVMPQRPELHTRPKKACLRMQLNSEINPSSHVISCDAFQKESVMQQSPELHTGPKQACLCMQLNSRHGPKRPCVCMQTYSHAVQISKPGPNSQERPDLKPRPMQPYANVFQNKPKQPCVSMQTNSHANA